MNQDYRKSNESQDNSSNENNDKREGSINQNEQENKQRQSGDNESLTSHNNSTTTNYPTDYNNHVQQENKPKSRGWIGGFAAGLLGGIIAAIVILLFFNNNDTMEQDSTESVEVSSTPQMIDTIDTDDEEISSSIAQVSEAVVGVVNLQEDNIWTGTQEAGTGSGIVYKNEDGSAYIVTNQHVVDGAENVEIVLSEEDRYPAEVLGEDPLTDLAVLQIDGENINTIAEFGSSDVFIGETVLAIGNPLGLEFANSVTRGIISGLNRSVPVDISNNGQPDWVTEVLQTDAAINPGNSGGALVNTNGEVIGINSMKIAQGAVEGIGFAIPVETALPIIEQLETEGEVIRPVIGISTASLYQVPPQYRYEIQLPDDIEGGMVVANVEPMSPADEAGLEQFDVITSINGETVTSILELRQYLYSEASLGESIEIEFIRDGEIETTELILEQTNEN